jgi:hypothetical protein
VALALAGAAAAEPAPTSSPTPGAGIRTDFGDVHIDNLGIGRTYNLRDLAGTPLKVTNTGRDTVNLVMSVEIPTGTMITENRQELGYRPIPSVDWVTLSRTQFIVPAGESAYSDVIIKIPDDPSLYGKKFQADIYSRTTGGDAFLHLGVWSHLQLSIAPSPQAQAEIEKNRKRGLVGNMEYTLLPDKLVIEKVPLGKTIDIRQQLKRSIMIANSGSDPIELRVKTVAIGDTPLSLQSGYQEGRPEWLRVKSATVKVDGSSFADTGLVLALPKDPSLAGKQLMFVIKVEPADPDVIGVTFYGKVYAEVAP